MSAYAEVVVTLPVEGRFHYRVPDHLLGTIAIGHRVLVPFGRRRATAFVVALAETVPAGVEEKIRPIAERLDIEPMLPGDVLALATFAADYYLGTVGEVLRIALPPGMTAASVARYTLTPEGRRHLSAPEAILSAGHALSPAARLVLESASKRTGVRAASVPAKAAHELELLGLIRRKDKDGLVRRKRARAMSVDAGEETATEAPLDGAEMPPELTVEQARALDAIVARIGSGTDPRTDPRTGREGGGAFLLHGVTGSGKTEVYLRSIAHARSLGYGAIVLVPEIALTPQLEARFRARFGDDVTVLHSALSDAERRSRWQRLRSGRANIALGPRSAVWAPVNNLGIVVVDEEHDASFKQSSDVRYHGRDLALTRAHQARGVAILGSATPSLESLRLVASGRLSELRLTSRALGRPMPTVEVVDLAEERRAMHGEVRVLSRSLGDKLRAVIAQGGQAILFLNRRGFNTVVYCEDCGAARRCAHCAVSLTLHKPASSLVCHYCGHLEALDAPCRECKSLAMSPFGIGTQRVVDAVKEAAPDARVLRLDRDVTSRAGELDRTLELFKRGEADVLVGTQMVAKGHDFPRVTLVGIVLADASLAFPDFRAAERTFQLLTQVAGRAGRADAPGHVIIQTLQPEHYALTCAIRHDSDAFFAIEGAQRKEAAYPPYSRIGLIRIESRDPDILAQVAKSVRRSAERVCQDSDLRWRGPVPCPIPRIRERDRQMLMILAPTPARLVAALRRIRADVGVVPKSVDLIFDVDPVDML